MLARSAIVHCTFGIGFGLSSHRGHVRRTRLDRDADREVGQERREKRRLDSGRSTPIATHVKTPNSSPAQRDAPFGAADGALSPDPSAVTSAPATTVPRDNH